MLADPEGNEVLHPDASPVAGRIVGRARRVAHCDDMDLLVDPQRREPVLGEGRRSRIQRSAGASITAPRCTPAIPTGAAARDPRIRDPLLVRFLDGQGPLTGHCDHRGGPQPLRALSTSRGGAHRSRSGPHPHGVGTRPWRGSGNGKPAPGAPQACAVRLPGRRPRDLGRALATFEDDCVYERQGRGTLRGPAELWEFYRSRRVIEQGPTTTRPHARPRLVSGEQVSVDFTDWSCVRNLRIVYRQSLFPGRAVQRTSRLTPHRRRGRRRRRPAPEQARRRV